MQLRTFWNDNIILLHKQCVCYGICGLRPGKMTPSQSCDVLVNNKINNKNNELHQATLLLQLCEDVLFPGLKVCYITIVQCGKSLSFFNSKKKTYLTVPRVKRANTFAYRLCFATSSHSDSSVGNQLLMFHFLVALFV